MQINTKRQQLDLDCSSLIEQLNALAAAPSAAHASPSPLLTAHAAELEAMRTNATTQVRAAEQVPPLRSRFVAGARGILNLWCVCVCSERMM